MQALARISPVFSSTSPTSAASLIAADSPRRAEAETFIQDVFAAHYGARVASFAPDIMLLERNGKPGAAAGWRGAASGRLFLESYLEQPAEALISRLAGHTVAREHVVEVGHLAALQAGGGVRMILTLAGHLDRLGYEWVIFTATRELIGIFTKMGLPPLALAVADPDRLGEAARDWGRYYDTRPIVVAGRIRLALEKEPFTLTGDAVGAALPPFVKGGAGGISEAATQANVAKSPSIPLWERGRPLPQALAVASPVNEMSQG
ncbi:MAG: thermostable hemolysin [Gallionellaceae bacterium]|nr:thermostable hemolysin [Gallionellaceae bacterium]